MSTAILVPDKPARAWSRWSPEELECLADCYGLAADNVLAGRLQRSRAAIVAMAQQKLRVRQTDNFYTAKALAEILGVPTSRTVMRWAKKGWLKGRRSSIHRGPWPLWQFTERAIANCLRQHPWLVVLKPTSQWLISDDSHHFFYIIRKQWQRDPWYTAEQVASLLGYTNPQPIYRYIHRGYLPAGKRPCRGGLGGLWIIRRSAIQAFLENDPRLDHGPIAASTARERFIEICRWPLHPWRWLSNLYISRRK